MSFASIGRVAWQHGMLGFLSHVAMTLPLMPLFYGWNSPLAKRILF